MKKNNAYSFHYTIVDKGSKTIIDQKNILIAKKKGTKEKLDNIYEFLTNFFWRIK